MNDTIQGVRVLGRRFKPVALGVAVMMLGLTIAGLFNLGDYAHVAFQHIGALFPLAAVGCLIVGWWKEDTRWEKAGLAVAFFSYLGRAIFLAIEDPLGDSLLLAIGTTIIIGGSYVCEVQDKGGK